MNAANDCNGSHVDAAKTVHVDNEDNTDCERGNLGIHLNDNNQPSSIKSYYQGVKLKEKSIPNNSDSKRTWSLTDDTIETNKKQRKGVIYQAKAKVFNTFAIRC